MKKLIFFSNNKNKNIEIKKLFQKTPITILNLKDFNKINSPRETGNTFEENAKIKSLFGLNFFKLPCFADDSGICIDAMNNKPGVDSKNFLIKNENKNAFKLIFSSVDLKKNYKAFFKTSICLSVKIDQHIFFNGKIEGTISKEIRGLNGFGYDPIFIPKGQSKTFAEMTIDKKNLISHRSIAINKLKKYLNKLI